MDITISLITTLVLTLINGYFSMSEMALTTAKRAVLEHEAEEGDKVKKGAKVLDDKGSVAVDKGSRALGKQLGKTRGMFKAFKDEYQKASGGSSKATK